MLSICFCQKQSKKQYVQESASRMKGGFEQKNHERCRVLLVSQSEGCIPFEYYSQQFYYFMAPGGIHFILILGVWGLRGTIGRKGHRLEQVCEAQIGVLS
jgi:hypothetical protein